MGPCGFWMARAWVILVSKMASQPQNTAAPRTSAAPSERYHRQLQAVMDVAWALNSALGIDALLAKIMERVTSIMRADRSTFFVVDRERRQLWSSVIQGDEPSEIRLPMGNGIAGWVAESGETVNLNDAYEDARFDRSWDEQSGYRTRSLLCVPIFDRGGETIAVIQCLNRSHRAFDDEDAELLSVIGAQCAVAIEKAMLYESLVERNRSLEEAEHRIRRAHGELEVLYEVEQQIAGAPDIPTMVAAVLRATGRRFEATTVGVLLRMQGRLQWWRLVLASGELEHDGGLAHGGRAAARSEADPDLVALAREAAGVPPDAPGVLHSLLRDGQRGLGCLVLLGVHGGEQGGRAPRLLDLVGAQLARGVTGHRERDRREREERLTVLGRSLSALVHDMRTPMAAISGYVELLAMAPDRQAAEDYAGRIDRALEHIEGMTREVLGFASGQREVLISKVYLDRFVSEVRELLFPEMERFGCELHVDQRFGGAARFDASKLKRVVFNLARNAGQAMEPGGRFTWRIEGDSRQVVFVCSDSGPGIPPEMEGRLFESFATHGKRDGTGLGLAMAKRIVEAHGGQLTCESHPGAGAEFRIVLPS